MIQIRGKHHAFANLDSVALDRCVGHVCWNRDGTAGGPWAKVERRGFASGHEPGVSRHGGSRQSRCRRGSEGGTRGVGQFLSPSQGTLRFLSEAGSAMPNAASAAEEVLKHHFTVVGIPYTFPGAVDWYFNPTTAPDSKFPRDHEWMWQLNRHREFATLARAYRATGDEKYAREFAQLLESWIRDCPVPEKEAWNAPGSPWRTIEGGIRTSTTWADCAGGVSVVAFRERPPAARLAQVVDRAWTLSQPASHATATGSRWK